VLGGFWGFWPWATDIGSGVAPRRDLESVSVEYHEYLENESLRMLRTSRSPSAIEFPRMLSANSMI
jgi:hypothetical protein